jgi:DNA recombination protein RmuC
MTSPMLVVLTLFLLAAVAASVLLARRLAVTQASLATAEACADTERRALERQLADVERAAEEKVALVRSNREEFQREMQAISAEVLQKSTAQVSQASLEARKTDRAELGRVVDPVAAHLKRLEEQVAQLERERKQTHGTVSQMVSKVTQEVDRLRTETGSLVNALRRPQVRGAWGEMQLRNCVEVAGMTAHVDFVEQQTLTDTDGSRYRPDMTVRLPGGKSIVVDSKVPLDAYLAAYDATEDSIRDAALDRHAKQVRTHLDTLASKAYHAQFSDSPEIVVCFIPNEAVYCAALDRDPTLFEHGMSRNVLVATPTTLVALLKSAYYGWRQETLAESAREIADSARELHKRLGTFLEPFSKLGRQLRSSVEAYNASVGSMEARVLPQLRRIEEAGAGSDKELAEASPIDSTPRLVAAVDVVAEEVAPAALPDAA